MNVKVRYFASLREKAGKSEEQMQIEDGKNLNDIYFLLSAKYGFDLNSNQIKFALNNDYIDPLVSPKENDVVVFIPPVAGG